ncbi:hypothetical protein HRbin36_00428 [bacterium HR36]|nr:hypothetical protein HRbin36_00428 [bacterium HR36]
MWAVNATAVTKTRLASANHFFRTSLLPRCWCQHSSTNIRPLSQINPSARINAISPCRVATKTIIPPTAVQESQLLRPAWECHTSSPNCTHQAATRASPARCIPKPEVTPCQGAAGCSSTIRPVPSPSSQFLTLQPSHTSPANHKAGAQVPQVMSAGRITAQVNPNATITMTQRHARLRPVSDISHSPKRSHYRSRSSAYILRSLASLPKGNLSR